jgi:hypothetical protein
MVITKLKTLFMFNLGTKQVVLNSSTNITEVDGVISIAGFGQFTIPTTADAATRVGAITVASAAVAAVYTITPAGTYDPTKVYDLVLGVRSSRQLSNIFTDGDVWTFQSKPGMASWGEAFAKGQIVGFNTDVLKFSGSSSIVVTFQPGYEGVSIEAIEMREVITDMPVAITSAVTTVAGSEGVGLGRQIEEEVQNATFENLDPYGSRGGSDTVDINGKYTEILWTCVAEDDDSPGWEAHAMTGYGDANTASTFAPRSFAAYINEAGGADGITILSKLVNGE